MGFFTNTPESVFLNKLRELTRQVSALTNRGVRLTVLDADPDTDSSLNIWMLADGRLRGRRPDGSIMEWATTTPAGSASTEPMPAEEYEPVSYIYAYSANWQQAYKGGGTTKYDNPAGRLFYGNIENGDGNYVSMMGFPNLSELDPEPGQSTTIVSVQLQIDNRYTYLPTGTTLKVGTHNQVAEPATFSETASAVAEVFVPSGVEVLVDLPVSIGNGLRDGTIQGLTFNQQSAVKSFYGYADSVALRIGYTK